tara:strand:- start:355 stop:945 length:591 start_codon:yes stop_codon:yes gene_type:complete
MNRFEYFSSCVYRDEQPEWVGYTRQVVQKYYDQAESNGLLDQTDHMANDPDLKFLVDYLVLASDTILREQGYDMDKYELYVSGLWGQDVKCNGGTDVHVHKHSQICGWFFLETPEGGAYPVYHEPRMNKRMVELDSIQESELTNASSTVHFNNIKPGTFLMANSWMQHQLMQNNSQAQTKSVHFIVSHRDRACSTY